MAHTKKGYSPTFYGMFKIKDTESSSFIYQYVSKGLSKTCLIISSNSVRSED